MGDELTRQNTSPTKFKLDGLSTSQTVLAFCLLEAIFYFGYKYGLSISQAVPSPFWFPDAVLVFGLLLVPPRMWWLLFLGWMPIRFFTGLAPGIPTWFRVAAFANDSIKALFIAVALRRSLKNPLRLNDLRDFGVFVAIAVLLAPMLSAFLGAGCRYLLGFEFWASWQKWFLSDALANLIVTPALLYWFVGGLSAVRRTSFRRYPEAVILVAGLVAAGLIAFTGPSKHYVSPELIYVPVPFLLWAGLRFGMRGATGALALTTFIAIAGAVYGQGPFSSQSAGRNVLSIQIFLFVISVPLFVVAILGWRKESRDARAGRSEQTISHFS